MCEEAQSCFHHGMGQRQESSIRRVLETRRSEAKLMRLCPCGKTLPKRYKKFCSIECMDSINYQGFLTRWFAGQESGMRGETSTSRYIKRYLVETFGECCSVCGWAERHPVTGRVPVELDHLNGNHEDNSPGNLRLLCPNHHSLTPNFRALNKGNGRAARRSVNISGDVLAL